MKDHEKALTPCRNECKLSGGICTACGRTIEEIANWMNYSDAEKKRILDRLSAFGVEDNISGKLNY